MKSILGTPVIRHFIIHQYSLLVKIGKSKIVEQFPRIVADPGFEFFDKFYHNLRLAVNRTFMAFRPIIHYTGAKTHILPTLDTRPLKYIYANLTTF